MVGEQFGGLVAEAVLEGAGVAFGDGVRNFQNILKERYEGIVSVAYFTR